MSRRCPFHEPKILTLGVRSSSLGPASALGLPAGGGGAAAGPGHRGNAGAGAALRLEICVACVVDVALSKRRRSVEGSIGKSRRDSWREDLVEALCKQEASPF
jgi:hypothetical protein